MLPPPKNKKSDVAGAWTLVAKAGDSPPASRPVHVEQSAMMQQLIHRVDPVDPEIPMEAHVIGTVVFHTIISKQGSINSFSVLSGPAMLVPVARTAVKRWIFRPWLANGEPVEVDTTIELPTESGK
jgi:hypothetical protein